MNFFRQLWDKFFGLRVEEHTVPRVVDTDDDPIMQAATAAFNSGKTVIGNRNEDGTFTFKEVGDGMRFKSDEIQNRIPEKE